MAGIAVVWLCAALAAVVYSAQYGVPAEIALKAFPAFLLEVTFFLFLGVEGLRRHLEKLSHTAVAFLLTVAGVLPYLAASLLFHGFDWKSLAWLAGLAAVVAFWHVILPRHGAVDVMFVILLGGVALLKIWKEFYPLPHPRVPLYVLGQLMWIRTGAMALLLVRKVQGVGFGFWPRVADWQTGALYYLMFLPVGAGVAYLIGFAQPHLPSSGWERTPVIAVGTFFGILWVVALGEEFLFRGLIQQWLGDWLRSPWAGLILASLLFGAVHLWYQAFPNWRFAVLAGLAGIFYGLAFRSAKSIRSSMVAHALTVTTLRLFFS